MLTVITPPAVEPVSVAEFRRDRRLDALAEDDTESEAYVDGLRTITAARGLVEQHTRRALVTQTLEVSASGRVVLTPVRLLRPPLVAVVSVTVTADGVDTELAATDYAFDPGNGWLWPAASGINSYPGCWAGAERVVVRYTAGYGDAPESVPAALRQAVLRIAGDLWEHREDSVVGTVAAKVTHTAAGLMEPFRVGLV